MKCISLSNLLLFHDLFFGSTVLCFSIPTLMMLSDRELGIGGVVSLEKVAFVGLAVM